jgi:hypothetical protein
MRAAAVAIALLAVIWLAAAAYVVVADPFADDSDPTVSRGLTGTACQRLAGLAAQLAEQDPAPAAFLAALGHDGAGIRSGSRGFADLLSGGHNRIRGRGFVARYDDGSDGQVRHFSGVAMATLFATGNPTLWISRHLRRDAPGSADDNLSEQAVAFSTAVLKGRLALDETSDWILARLCRRPA